MPGLTEAQLNAQLEQQRLITLYERLPASVSSILVGVLLVFVVLLSSAQGDLLKAWAAYMLSTVALRGWIWHVFTTNGNVGGHSQRWEWAYSLSAMLTGLGWALLSGPLFPADIRIQAFVIGMMLIVGFSGTVYLAISHSAFWLFLTPTIVPALARYVEISTLSNHAALVAAISCLMVLLIIQITLRRFALRSIRRQVEAEALLAEQQAIFQAAPMGILVISERKIVKCNPRLGELFHRNLQDMQTIDVGELFATAEEAEKFAIDMRRMLKPGKTASGIYRLRRADATEFWAELSGRLLNETGLQRSIWTIADIALRNNPEPHPHTGAASPAPSFADDARR